SGLVGNHWLVIQTDANNTIKEYDATGPLDGNNTTVSAQPLTIEALLTLSIVPSGFSEAAGAQAAQATVTRNSDTSQPLVVTLANSNTADMSAPATVTIPAGQSSISFAIGAIDNAMVDGTRTATLTASAAGMTSGTAAVTVTDDDVPTLTL